MKRNVGGMDRVVRILLGVTLIVAAAAGEIGAWGWIGIVPLMTGVFSYCWLYRLLGINTCPTPKK